MKLTVSNIKAVPANGKRKLVTLARGLYLRIEPSGKKIFLTKIRANGKATMRKLGVFDGTGASIKSAQIELAKLQSEVATDRYEPPGGNGSEDTTFNCLWNEYIRIIIRDKKNRETTIKDKERFIARYALPEWGNLHIYKITNDMIRNKHERMLQKNRWTADKLVRFLSSFFTWAKNKRHITYNPCEGIETLQSGNYRRERELFVNELQNIWFALEKLDYPVKQLYQLLLLTGQRKSVVAHMRWDQFDREADGTVYWIIPRTARGTKGNKPFRLKLTLFARKILNEIPRSESPYVFPARHKPDRPVDGFSKFKKRIESVMQRYDRQVNDWKAHDFRRTIISKLQSQGWSFEVRQTLLGHKRNSEYGAMGHYNLYSYEVESNQALEQWTDWLLANVIYPDKNESRMQKEYVAGTLRKPRGAMAHFGTRAFE